MLADRRAPTSEERVCPRCGRKRTGYFQYCFGCRFDFEEAAPSATMPAVVAPARPAIPPPATLPARRPTERPATEPIQAETRAVATGAEWRPPRPTARSSSRSILRYGTIGVIALIGLGAISNLSAPTATPTPSAALTLPTPTSPPTAAPTSSTIFGPTGPTEVATVTRVTDGDTIRVSIDGVEYPVRYIGIDSPEPDATDPVVRELAATATAANEGLVGGQDVVLERDVSETDPFDRLLRHVWLIDGERALLVNEELVRLGFAQVSTFPPDVKYVDRLTAAQETATATDAGMWAPEVTATPTPTPASTAAPTRAATVDGSQVVIRAGSRAAFRGVAGLHRFTALDFPLERATVRWSVTASADEGCRVSWRMQPNRGDDIARTVRVAAGATVSDSQRYATPFSDARLVVDSSCPKWLVTMQADPRSPATPPPASGAGGSGCHPSYQGICLRTDVSDYDCAGRSGDGPYYVIGQVRVVGPDEYRLDGDGNGIGCD